jgi:hypothetical protein
MPNLTGVLEATGHDPIRRPVPDFNASCKPKNEIDLGPNRACTAHFRAVEAARQRAGSL